MGDFENKKSSNGFTMKLWRGERMCLLAFDVQDPEPDFVGFAIECKEPGAADFKPLKNRLAFSYDGPAAQAVTGARKFDSTESPFQKFRWLHFPNDPRPGNYVYRATKMHMPKDDAPLKTGVSLSLPINLDPVTYHDFLDIGFTRNFASSQAFLDRVKAAGGAVNTIGAKIIPSAADDGLRFKKMPGDIYQWLGFEACDQIFNFLNEAVKDKKVELDVFAYDLNEPDIVELLKKMGPRLRVIIDDSSSTKEGVTSGHGVPGSAESQAAKKLAASAGKKNVKRLHFSGLQHNKVFIAKRNGVPFEVLSGSTNFSFRGLYIQANNILVFSDANIAGYYGKVFELAFNDAGAFKKSPLAAKWHAVTKAPQPPIQICFSPHTSSDLSLCPVQAAIEQADSSVLYSVAFLNQIKSGPTKSAFDRLMQRPVFSYGVVDKKGGLEVQKPDGSIGMVDFAYLAANAPEPFKSEWSSGKGINVHHKFVVTDFSLPTAKVFTGSSNFAPSGEEKNGDNLIMICDPKIATSYAIEALRVFDHLHFRSRMKDAGSGGKKKKPAKGKKADTLVLKKPKKISGKPPWFEEYYVKDSQKEKDRLLFSA
jgi:phosphatidylserine/phosphatidylglycerophosphate/cardiolipin synthase-like enzyme